MGSFHTQDSNWSGKGADAQVPCVEPSCKIGLANGGYRCPDCEGVMHGICGTDVREQRFSQRRLFSPCKVKRTGNGVSKSANAKWNMSSRAPSPTSLSVSNFTPPAARTVACTAQRGNEKGLPVSKRPSSRFTTSKKDTDQVSSAVQTAHVGEEKRPVDPKHSAFARPDSPSAAIAAPKPLSIPVSKKVAATQKKKSVSATKEIRKTNASTRVRLTYQQKLTVLVELGKGRPQHLVADSFGVGLRTVSRILKDKDLILSKSNTPMAKLKSTKQSDMVVLDSHVLEFLRRQNMPITSLVIRAAALRDCKKLLEAGVITSAKEAEALKQFKASYSWFKRFVKRYGIRSAPLNGVEQDEVGEINQSPDNTRLLSVSLLTISKKFEPLEEFLQYCNVGEVSEHLRKAKEALIRAKEEQKPKRHNVGYYLPP